MPDLGSIGMDGGNGFSYLAQGSPLPTLRCMMAGEQYMVFGGKDVSEGNPQPSLRMDAFGVWWWLRYFSAGTHSVSIDVKQATNMSPRPSLVVKADPSLGVNSDVTASAASGTGWVTIGPATVILSSAGVLKIELHNNFDGQFEQFPCFWDNAAYT